MTNAVADRKEPISIDVGRVTGVIATGGVQDALGYEDEAGDKG
jgi:hypothetical protein